MRGVTSFITCYVLWLTLGAKTHSHAVKHKMFYLVVNTGSQVFKIKYFSVAKIVSIVYGFTHQLFMVLLISCSWFYQSLFKTSHVTRRPSLKRLSGIQVQLLSLWMGKHQILQNRSLSLRLNFIFEITNEIGQQLCPKCCFFCSNSVIKSLFLRLD